MGGWSCVLRSIGGVIEKMNASRTTDSMPVARPEITPALFSLPLRSSQSLSGKKVTAVLVRRPKVSGSRPAKDTLSATAGF